MSSWSNRPLYFPRPTRCKSPRGWNIVLFLSAPATDCTRIDPRTYYAIRLGLGKNGSGKTRADRNRVRDEAPLMFRACRLCFVTLFRGDRFEVARPSRAPRVEFV